MQMKILENHQNGKDTHVRGLQIYAGEDGARPGRAAHKNQPEETGTSGLPAEVEDTLDIGWMAEPVLR